VKYIGKCGPCSVFASYTLALCLKTEEKSRKTSVRVVEKCPDIPVIHEKAVYKIFVHSISRKRGDTQSRGRWEMRAY
jgi:hypothetical protein